MKIAIMQPYIFPYVGYFQLIDATDKFVIYDDVNFITRGWINRNSILVGSQPKLFSIPLEKKSQNIPIYKTMIKQQEYSAWCTKFLKTLEHAYSRSVNYQDGIALIKHILSHNCKDISSLATASVIECCDYIGINTKIIPSSRAYKNEELSRVDRLIDIIRIEDCSIYINAPGGKKLYKASDFESTNIKLQFLKPKINTYQQLSNNFFERLSIIDIIMNNKQDELRSIIEGYCFESASL